MEQIYICPKATFCRMAKGMRMIGDNGARRLSARDRAVAALLTKHASVATVKTTARVAARNTFRATPKTAPRASPILDNSNARTSTVRHSREFTTIGCRTPRLRIPASWTACREVNGFTIVISQKLLMAHAATITLLTCASMDNARYVDVNSLFVAYRKTIISL